MYSAIGVSVAAAATGIWYLLRGWSEGRTPERVFTWYSPLLLVSSFTSVFYGKASSTALYSLIFAGGLVAGLLSTLSAFSAISAGLAQVVYSGIGVVAIILVVISWPYELSLIASFLLVVSLVFVAASAGRIVLGGLDVGVAVQKAPAVLLASLGVIEVFDFVLRPYGLAFVWDRAPALEPWLILFICVSLAILSPEFTVSAFAVATIGFQCTYELWSWFEFKNFGNPLFRPTWQLTLAMLSFFAGFSVFSAVRLFVRFK